MRIAEALSLAVDRLAAAGVPASDFDAEVLLRHVLGWDRATLFTRADQCLTPSDRERFFALVEERTTRRPLQQITARQAFWRHDFLVTPDVLVPRRETELLVEAALELLVAASRPVIVDVGTGTGCIALSLALERPAAEVHATDVSPTALAVAGENARRLHAQNRVTFHLGDLLEPVVSLADRIDLVACNPPYLDPSEPLPPEVRDHDPPLALFPPGDRYTIYRRLIPQAVICLRAGGFLVLEVGYEMADQVSSLCEAGGLEVSRILPDLSGIPRAILALKR